MIKKPFPYIIYSHMYVQMLSKVLVSTTCAQSFRYNNSIPFFLVFFVTIPIYLISSFLCMNNNLGKFWIFQKKFGCVCVATPSSSLKYVYFDRAKLDHCK